MLHTKPKRGSALLFTLFFSSLFIVGFGALLSYIVVQHNAVREEVWKAQALGIADAGTQYYRWHLAHAPSDYSSDTGTHTYTDPYGGTFGEYTIGVTQPSAGSTIAIITTAGSPSARPAVQARVRARYGKRSIANFAFLSNSNVWFGDTESIDGQMHSNGGVRMDGTANSSVTSEQATYTCGAEHGCSNTVQPGVWGTGVIASLWEYPVNEVDFNSFHLDLTSMQTSSISGGIHLGASGGYGYYVDFHSNGTLTINKVTAVQNPVTGYNGSAWVSESNDKKTWSAVSGYNNVSIPSNGLIFLEDNVWVGGTVSGRATIVAARMPEGSATPADIYIQDSTRYLARDGTNALGLIAQQDVLVPLRSDDNLVIDAALMAINGHTYRYYYTRSNSEPYKTYAVRSSIQTYGILVTNTTWTWSWVNGSNVVTSGYNATDTVYDPDLLYAPPPYFPTESNYSFISWEQLTLDQQ
jgi:hypothetical protein